MLGGQLGDHLARRGVQRGEQIAGAKAPTLENFDAPVYFPNGNGAEIPEVMQFRVTEKLSDTDRTTPPATLALPPVTRIRQTPETPRRQFVLDAPVDDRRP
ncbi:hypothetical protein [Streptomyces sp. NPDC102437]|uniref:hypothetical protein n=1 Tax=Streptomyces sp. NPDC102437 TaxID=3366175 RepID=UPI00380E469B